MTHFAQGGSSTVGGRYVAIEDTRLFIVDRGQGYPIIILHGGPGLDHTMFGDYLDSLASEFRLVFVDQRSQGRSDRTTEGTWTIKQMAQDVVSLAKDLELDRYAVLGHSFGAFVALQNAVSFPGHAAQTIVSSGVPGSSYLEAVERNLKTFEPEGLRKQVASSWEKELSVQTEDEVASLLGDQLPFHFADPLDPRITEYEKRTPGAVYSPDVLRHFSNQEYGGIEVEDKLGQVNQPVLVLVGRFDRVCPVEAAQAIARGVPLTELVVFENSGHMTFVEENKRYLKVVQGFIKRHIGMLH